MAEKYNIGFWQGLSTYGAAPSLLPSRLLHVWKNGSLSLSLSLSSQRQVTDTLTHAPAPAPATRGGGVGVSPRWFFLRRRGEGTRASGQQTSWSTSWLGFEKKRGRFEVTFW